MNEFTPLDDGSILVCVIKDVGFLLRAANGKEIFLSNEALAQLNTLKPD